METHDAKPFTLFVSIRIAYGIAEYIPHVLDAAGLGCLYFNMLHNTVVVIMFEMEISLPLDFNCEFGR